MQDYSNAAPAQDFSVIPAGTIAFGVIKIRPFGADTNNQPIAETDSKTSDAKFLDCEVTILRGPFAKRKVFTRIGTAGSEKYVNMGRTAIRSILEVGRQASQANAAGYQIKDYMDLNGLTVAIDIKVEKGSAGYSDKNEVACWLTPNPDSSTNKKFSALVEMDRAGYPGGSGGAAKEAPAATSAAPWAEKQAAMPQAAQTLPGATTKPAWL